MDAAAVIFGINEDVWPEDQAVRIPKKARSRIIPVSLAVDPTDKPHASSNNLLNGLAMVYFETLAAGDFQLS
jgi:hypothetical protein